MPRRVRDLPAFSHIGGEGGGWGGPEIVEAEAGVCVVVREEEGLVLGRREGVGTSTCRSPNLGKRVIAPSTVMSYIYERKYN